MVKSTHLQEVTMAQQPPCGPESDRDFFKEVAALFNKFPGAAEKYTIGCTTPEMQSMKIDFEKEVGVSRIEGKQLVTEYMAKEEAAKFLPPESVGEVVGTGNGEGNGDAALDRFCCEWKISAGRSVCVRICS
jgi:hypothetical protein